MHAGHSCSAAALTPALALQTVRLVTTLSTFNNVIMSSARRPHRPYLDGGHNLSPAARAAAAVADI